MPDRERRRWADTATGLGLTGQTAAAGTTVTELAAGWGTGQSAAAAAAGAGVDGGGGPDRRVVPPRGRG